MLKKEHTKSQRSGHGKARAEKKRLALGLHAAALGLDVTTSSCATLLSVGVFFCSLDLLLKLDAYARPHAEHPDPRFNAANDAR